MRTNTVRPASSPPRSQPATPDAPTGGRARALGGGGHRLATLGTAVIALAVLAGCGGSSPYRSGTTTTAAAGASGSSTTPAAGLTVTVKMDAKLGAILADPSGQTLYTLTDGGKAIDCTGPCLATWPPLELASGASGPTAPDGVTLTVVDGPDSSKLVAADDLPLYTFAGDGSPTDTNGEGMASFGGTWHVVKTTASVTPAGGAATTAPDATTTTSDSGY